MGIELSRIMAGYTDVEIGLTSYRIAHGTPMQDYELDTLYERELSLNRMSGMISEKQMMRHLYDVNLWSVGLQKELKILLDL